MAALSTMLAKLADAQTARDKPLKDAQALLASAPTKDTGADARSARAAEAELRRRASAGSGRKGTILTGPAGVAPSETSTQRKTLLGL